MADDRLGKAATFVDNWWKILSVGIALVFLIYQVSVVWIKAKEMEQSIEQLKLHIEEENSIRDERSDKRYQRATEMYNELTERGIRLTMDYQNHLVDDAYFRGKTDANINNLKNK